MYIHRVAIDTNRLNARGSVLAMTELERLHDAHMIEIVCTSTVITDAKGIHRAKSTKYDLIYGDYMGYLTEQGIPDVQPGPALRTSRFFEIYENVFGSGRGPEIGDHHAQSIRDVLHIDQCWQNMVDYFITGDVRLQRCSCVDFKIIDAEECLEEIHAFFQKIHGTADLHKLSQIVFNDAPIILGSNTIGPFEARAAGDAEALLGVEIAAGEASVYGTIRDRHGHALLRFTPGADYEFSARNASVSMIAGPSPLKFGNKHCKSFSVMCEGHALLAGRYIRPGRIVLFEALLRASDGREALVIHRDALELRGCSLSHL